jgi:lipopolysaccharide/colanic/teichoic acid biosynthesis glycosyltransferase
VATEPLAMTTVAEVQDALAPAPPTPLAQAASPLSQVLGDARRRELGYAFVKRLIDVLGAAFLLVVLLPLLIAIAIAIRLDSRGPALYRAERIGRFGKPFSVAKFRSMRTGCSTNPHVQFVRSLLREGKTCDLYKVEADTRVTRVGAFLRRTSMDELPQLWNVLRGDMSLVGPRPDVRYAVEDYDNWIHRRLDVKPGMTGLWQVSGRSRLGLLDMYKLDVKYVEQASLLFDLKLLVRTIPVVLGRDGAA